MLCAWTTSLMVMASWAKTSPGAWEPAWARVESAPGARLEVVRRDRALGATLVLLLLGRRMEVDLVDPPLVVFLAEHDAITQAVLVPPHLGAVGRDLIDAIVDALADPA